MVEISRKNSEKFREKSEKSEQKFREKSSVVVVFTGDGKGKTSAALGLILRALGAGKKVAFVQFIKSWEVSEHKFFAKFLADEPNFSFFEGGEGFVNLGAHSAKNVSKIAHEKAAKATLNFAKNCARNGKFDLVICDEIAVALHENLLSENDLRELIISRNPKTSLCLTGRNFPENLAKFVDILTEMKKIKHHFDDGFLANLGIDY